MSFTYQGALLFGGDLDTDERNPDNPRIGYSTINDYEGASISLFGSLSSESPEKPLSNVLNSSTYDYTHGLIENGSRLNRYTIHIPQHDGINFVAIAGHNFKHPLSNVQLMAGTDPSTMDFDFEMYESNPLNGERNMDGSPIFFQFEETQYNYFRLNLDTGGNAVPRLSNIFIGKALEMPRRVWVGHSPLSLSHRTTKSFLESNTGEFLGGVVRKLKKEGAVNIQNIPLSFYREKIQPFVEKARYRPFVFAWRPNTYKHDVHLCWISGDPSPSIKPGNLVDLNLSLTAKEPTKFSGVFEDLSA